MVGKQQNFNIKYFNNAVVTLTIWLTILNRPTSTKNPAGAMKITQNTTSIMNNHDKYNYSRRLIENEVINGTEGDYQHFALSTLYDFNMNNRSKLKTDIYHQRSFQHPSGFMLPDYSSNDYVDKHPNTPKFMSSSMSSSPVSSSEHVQPNNYHRYGPHDSMPSDDKEYESYSVPDDYHHYHHHPQPHHVEYVHPPMMMTPMKSISSFISTDSLKIIVIILLKLLLIKLSVIGLIKLTILFLLKLPILFFGFLLKILFFVKISNIFKILSLPILLPFLLIILAPLLLPLLAPLLLLPLLLPLLLFLPIPILTITTTTSSTTTTTAAPGRRRRRRYLEGSDFIGYNSSKWSKGKGDLEFFRHLIESEMCFERIACKLAADKNATPFSDYISRILETVKYYLFNPRLDSYVRAYKFGSSKGTTFAACVRYYPCTKFKT